MEDFGPYIEYIQDNKNIVEDSLPIFLIFIVKETTHEYTYKKIIV